jgi:hypothetical protein
MAARVPNSMKRTSGNLAAVISPLDGSIFNDVFLRNLLDFSAIWILNSRASCSQHSANKQILLSEARSTIKLTAGLHSDFGQRAHWHNPHNV